MKYANLSAHSSVTEKLPYELFWCPLAFPKLPLAHSISYLIPKACSVAAMSIIHITEHIDAQLYRQIAIIIDTISDQPYRHKAADMAIVVL